MMGGEIISDGGMCNMCKMCPRRREDNATGDPRPGTAFDES